MAIYESKLDDNDSEKMLSLSGYKLVRRDRNKQGGGVFVYERHSLSFNELNSSKGFFFHCVISTSKVRLILHVLIILSS